MEILVLRGDEEPDVVQTALGRAAGRGVRLAVWIGEPGTAAYDEFAGEISRRGGVEGSSR